MPMEWTELALADVAYAVASVAHESGAAAASMAQRLWAATRQLAYHPDAGRPGRGEGTRELVVPEAPYLVLYTLAAGRVVVVRMLLAVC